MSYAGRLAVFLNCSRLLTNCCVRMTAGLSLKHSGSHPAIVAATADCPMFILIVLQPTDLLFWQRCSYFCRFHRRYPHNETLALLSPTLKTPHIVLLFGSKCLCVIHNHYIKHKSSVEFSNIYQFYIYVGMLFLNFMYQVN